MSDSITHWLIGAHYSLPSDISRRLESITPSFDINVQHGGRTKSTCSCLVLEAEWHLRGEDIKMYHPLQQQAGKRGFCDVLRAWRPAGSNVGGGTRGRFEGGFLINIVPSKRRIGQATIDCSSSLFRPVRRGFEIILLKLPA